MRKSIILTTIALTLAGCTPSQEQQANAYYGAYPNDYQAVVQSFFAATLKDPASAQYTFTPPSRGWNALSFETKYGWRVCGTINAKNGFGGYSGAQPFYTLVRDGVVIDSIGPVSYSSSMASLINGACTSG